MMRRTILAVVVGLVALVMAAPAALAIPKDNPTWGTYCDMDGDPSTGTGTITVGTQTLDLDGRETFTVQSAAGVPGWTEDSAVPSLFLGGHAAVYEEGQLADETDIPTPPGMASRATYCLQFGPLEEDPSEFVAILDPLYLFFAPPVG